MKSSNLWRIIWIVGIYILLGIILYLVVVYKVEWEQKDLNTYLYLYDCGMELCSSTTSQKDYYNKVLCDDDVCPYIYDIQGENVIFKKENLSWIYNYVRGEDVTNAYNDYRYIGNNLYAMADSSGKYGIIDSTGKVVVEPKYNYITDYKDGFIAYRINEKYGIISTDGTHKINENYEDIVLINDKIFAGRKDNVYHLYSYENPDNENANKYNYVYAYGDILFVINNKKIDILDSNLNSTLLMKIDTFYEYTAEKERDSLHIYSDGKYIYFRVFKNDTEYVDYMYKIKDKKLI